MDRAAYDEAVDALERLLPRVGAPVVRRRLALATGVASYLEAGGGAPVVLLHGGFGGAGNWHRTVGPLSLHYRVLVPDRPGYGLSEQPVMADEAAWLDAFLAAVGVDQAVLVGHASGAATALAYASAYPARVRALGLSDLVLTDPAADRAPAAATTRRPRTVETWYASIAARFDDRRALAAEYLAYLWTLAVLRPEQDQRPPGAPAPGPVPLPAPGARTWPARPILLVWGRGNRWAPLPLARLLHQRIPDAWLRVIDHSKGVPALEQPGEFNHALLSFLRERSMPDDGRLRRD